MKRLVSKAAEIRALDRLVKRTARLSPDDRATVKALDPIVRDPSHTPNHELQQLQRLAEKYDL